MFHQLRRLPPLAFGALAISIIGVIAEVTFHFLPPQTIPLFDSWFNSLNAVDKDFFSSSYELIAHFFIGLGLAGMITAFAQMQLATHENDHPNP